MDNKLIALKWMNILWNDGDLDFGERLIDINYIRHHPLHPMNKKQYLHYIKAFHKGSSDLHYEIQDIVAENDKILVRWVATGTHDGKLAGIKPTGNKIKIHGMDLLRILDNKLIESWACYDSMSLIRQLKKKRYIFLKT